MLVGEGDWGARHGQGEQVMGWEGSHGWGESGRPMGRGAWIVSRTRGTG